MKVAKVKIENFRGIRHPLELEFRKGSNFTSVALYGRNGNGKSSIVDSWEWLFSDQNKIDHLAREGAAEREFPHKASGGDDCYIEVEFEGQDNFVRQDYNKRKVKQPIITGKYQNFKEKAKHPCHLRYRDLQTFVYQTKSERYKYLAKYLGFEQQLQIQENLITERNRLRELEKKLTTTFHRSIENVNQILDKGDTEKAEDLDQIEREIINIINQTAVSYSIEKVSDFSEVGMVKERLETLIREDPNAVRLTTLKSYKTKLDRFRVVNPLKEEITELSELFYRIKENEANVSKLILLKLYKNGLDVLQGDSNICPLCDNRFNGSLHEHIESKYNDLSSLKAQREEFNISKTSIISKFSSSLSSLEKLLIQNENDKEHQTFYKEVELLKIDYETIKGVLSKNMEDILSIPKYSESILNRVEKVNELHEEVVKYVVENIRILEHDESRQKLANDFQKLNKVTELYLHFIESRSALKYFEKEKAKFDQVDDLFSNWIKTEIQASFDQISGNVVRYFNILESSNQNITNPRITLLIDKDKAVELEIEFANRPVYPAFKVLSESQINSFGLSVFLAAIRQFNTEFKFVVLDDVVNSFDAYKRPKVIDLLNIHFGDFQVLVLTHDSIWFDRLQRTFPKWNRIKFTGWDYNTGPKMRVGRSIFEEIDHQLENDSPIQAGQQLGRYLEWTLQEFNQNFETPIKYKFDNQYALGELFDAFKSRLFKKLKANHKLTKLVNNFSEKTIFRNYCAHYKAPETEYTKEEITEIFESWKEIESMMTCKECLGFVKLVKPQGHIKCRCNKLDLLEEKYFDE